MFLDPLIEAPTKRHQLINRRTGACVADDVQAALDSASRKKGLLGKDQMAPGSALVIAPTGAIHTWFMRFDIDVAFVARDGRVIKLRHRMKPWRIFGALRAFAVVELPAGALSKSGIQTGDFVDVIPAS